MIARTTRTLFEIVAASLLGVMLLAGAGAWRLAQGPIPLDFLTQHLVRALNSHDAPIRVTLERTILAWAGWDRALDIRVVGVKATGEDGKVIARVPEMSVSMSLVGLLQGIVAPRSLDLMGASVSLVRSRTGEFAMMLGASGDDSAAELVARIVHAVGAAPDPDRPITYLRRVSILGAGLTIDDRLTGAVWGAPRADLILLREAGEIRGAFFVELDIGGASTRVNGAASWRPNSEIVRVETDIAGARIDRIAAKVPRLKGLEGLRLGVNGRLDLTLSTSGALRSARFDLASGEGHLAYAALWPEGVPVKSARLQGHFDGDTESLDLERVTVGLDGTQLSGRVSAIRVGDGIAIDGRVEADRVSVADIGRYWPASVARLARAWVTKNMPAGIAEQGRAGFSLRVADPSAGGVSLVSLSGALRLRDTTIHYLEGMPPIRDVAGTAVFSRDRFIARVREAKSQGLSIGSGTVRLTRLDTDDEQANIDVTIDGSLADALALVDQPRLGFASRLGVRPRSVEGRATTHLAVSLPMRRDVQLSDSRIEATSQLRNVRVPDLVFGQPISAQSLALRVDRTRLEISGEARIAEVPATVKWMERFDSGAHPARQYHARAVLDDEQRRALGLAALAQYLDGPVSVDLALVQSAAGPREMALSLGLKDATLSLPLLQWRKPGGQDATASLALLLEQTGAVRVRDFDLRTPSLQARGAVSFDRDRELAEVRLEEFVHGRTNVAGILQARPDGAWAIQLKGASFDATPFLELEQADTGERTAPAWPPLLVRADIDRLWITEKAAIGKVMGKLVRDRSGWNEISVSGTIGQAKGVTLSYGREGAAGRLRVHSNDAGELLRTFDLIETVQGGEFVLSAAARDASGEARWTGTLQITDFVLGEVSLMAQILTSASLTGIADMMSGRGIRFVKLDAPFDYRGGMVTVRNARTVGSELGITAEGEIDTEGDRLALTGTIVPAYTLNSLLGNIPILGNILTGKQGSGIFAATYRVDGPIREPTVRVNPLAALAPGFLRNLIGIFDGTTRVDPTPPAATDTN